MAKFKVDVITTTRDNPDEIQSRRVIDYNLRRDRLWLGNHTAWALRHNYAVHTAAFGSN